MNGPATDFMGYLLTRRSIPSVRLVSPAPQGVDLDRILTAAARVPDHGKVVPWRFIVLSGEARHAYTDYLIDIWRTDNPSASAEAERIERLKRDGAPLLVVVVSRAGAHPKIPVWEQELSVGAACMNLVHAAHGSGFAAQWLTGWPAYDARIATLLGVREGERIAGFVHIGTPDEAPVDRDRPALDDIVTYWRG